MAAIHTMTYYLINKSMSILLYFIYFRINHITKIFFILTVVAFNMVILIKYTNMKYNIVHLSV